MRRKSAEKEKKINKEKTNREKDRNLVSQKEEKKVVKMKKREKIVIVSTVVPLSSVYHFFLFLFLYLSYLHHSSIAFSFFSLSHNRENFS